jgi:hypothetical protein
MKRYIENEEEEIELNNSNKKIIKKEAKDNSNKIVKKYFKIIEKSKNEILNDSIQGNMGLMAHAIEIEYKKLHATEILPYNSHICNVENCSMSQLFVRISYTNINTSDIDYVLRNSDVEDESFIDQQIYHIAFLSGQKFRQEYETSHNCQMRKTNVETTELLLANLYICQGTGKIHVCGEQYCRMKNNKVKGNYVCPLTGMMLGSVLSHDLDWMTPLHYSEANDKFNKETGLQYMSNRKIKNDNDDNRLEIIIKIVRGLLFSVTRQIHEITLLQKHYSKIKEIIKSCTKQDKTRLNYYDACSKVSALHLKQLKRSDYFLHFPIINNSIKKIISKCFDNDDDLDLDLDLDLDDDDNNNNNYKKKHTCNNNNNGRNRSFSKQIFKGNCKVCELNNLKLREKQLLTELNDIQNPNTNTNSNINKYDEEVYDFSKLILKVWNNITEKYNKSMIETSASNNNNNYNNNNNNNNNQLSLYIAPSTTTTNNNNNNGRKRDILPKFPQLAIYIMYAMKAGGMKIPSRKRIINEKENIFIVPNQEDTVTVIPTHYLAKYLPPEDSLDIYKSETMFESLQTVKISDISSRMQYYFSVILETTNPIELDMTS